LFLYQFGSIEQLAAQRTVNPPPYGTGGSNPSTPTKYKVVAQLVAHLLWEQGVAGSSPVYLTKLRDMEESGRPRSPWTREFAGSNPAIPTKFFNIWGD
jgi:hypothetical protein